MKLKKILALALACTTVVAGFAGCGEKEDKVYNIGICQLVQHTALDAATQGFQDALTEKLGDKVSFDLQNAAGDSITCGTIVNKFVSDKVDLIMANATASLQSAFAATADIPIVATSITDYATALDIDDWTGKTGVNVTGTCDLAPLNEQAAMIKELFPDAKKVGILYCATEANSKYQAVEIAKYLTDLGIESEEFTCSDSNDVAMVTSAACEASDVIYIPTDNMMASSTGIVDGVAGPAGVPIVAGEAGICKGCGVATLSIDYYSIGYAAGEQAYEILVNGADPAEMEIGYASELTKQYIAERCSALGVEVPSDYEAVSIEEE
ncbi:MAG: ABC transporter substrate-binding protein [Lachnospiraceae bacterium]|nr:ABC transporter substrate-binding protein [Lachnospiraceae bacterium]